MNNNYENKILDAIQTLVDTAVSRAGYDKTIKAVISKCVNQNTGKYVVKYQDSSFYAYSNDLDSVYNGGTPVYVLVPGNDMSQTKTILGSVDKLGTEYINLSESSSAYQEVGTSVVTPNGTIPGISSYKSGGDSLVIYDRTASSGNTVNVDTEGAEIYFQNAQYIEIGGTFTTRLNEEQKRRGNYGLVFDISFKDGEEEVHKNYVIDINSMTGNPYSYNYGSAQTAIFQIDGANFYRLNSITLECKNFPHSATPANADIFVEDIVLKALTPLTRDEIANNSLTFITKQGIYFNEDDSADATRLIETEVKINKKIVPNTGGLLRFYWFKEDGTVGITSSDYLPFGGPGWKCINAYNVIDETSDIRDYITDVDTLTVVKSGNPAKENEYKCVVIYNDEIQVERNIIIYNQTSEYTITIESDQGNYFKYNEGNPTLTCSVNPTGTYTYIWTVTDSSNRTEVLTETNNTYSVQLSNIANFSKFTCSVYSNGNFVGKSNIVITNSWDPEDNSYALVMENSDQIFKYNEKGIAPTNKSLEKPIVLKPLQFVLYDEMGHQVDDNKILSTDVFWYVPKNDTMIKVSDSGIAPTEEDGYLVYSGLKTLNFTIANIYNIKKLNNTIKLVVKYNDRVLNTVSELEFIKEGEIGSNGTDFVCRIVPNVASGGAVPTYPIFTANMSTNPVVGDMNYNRPNGQSDKWFKVQLYKDGVQIYEGVASGTSEENKSVAIEWSMLKNRYTSSVVDSSSFTVDSSTGAFTYVDLDDDLDRAANLVKVIISYDGATYYATMPIILVQAINTSGNTYTMDLVENTGFRYVMYSTDGLNPLYDSSNPFALKAYRGTTNITDNNNITFTYSTLGQTYDGTTWINENNFITKTHGVSNPLAKNEADYRPIEKFNGLSVNNAVKCIVKESNVEIVRAYLPIHFYLNRFGNAALNGWDGNHIEINNNGGFILAPQVGAGKKESDNSYTGIFMGNVREAGSSVDEVGLYGYYKGTRTIALDTKDGSARFGKQSAGQIVIDPSTADYSGKGTARIYSNDYSVNYIAPSSMSPPQTKYLGGYSYWKIVSDEYYLMKCVDENVIEGYYYNGAFYSNSEHTSLLTPINNRNYHDIDSKKCYIYKNNSYTELPYYYKVGDPIPSSVRVWAGGEGLEIDLNDPHIRFGSGKFRIDSDGQVYATGFASVTSIEAGDYIIPSAAINVGGGDNLNDYMSDTQNTLEDLQSQIDGNISTYFEDYVPTLSNEPAVSWTTPEEKDNHLGDLFYNTTTGYCYRFMKTSSGGVDTYSWGQLSDSDIAAALAAAQAAQETADTKAEVFVSSGTSRPTPPYNVGDLWIKDSDLYRCNTAWVSGAWNDSHWELATDYTNDSAVNTLKTEVISNSEVQYALGDDATTAPTTGWSTSTPTWTEGKYVWQRTVVTYADSTQSAPHTDTSDPVCIQGAKGEPGSGGRGIASTEIKYQASNSGTTAPTGTWQTNVPSISPGQFLWTRTVITYTDGLNPTTSYSVSYDGTNGTSITITTQNVTYAESTSGTTAPTTGWQSSIPNVDDGKFLWTKTYVKYSDNTETTSYSVSYQSVDGYTLWTYPSDPTASSGTYTFTRSSMVGPSEVDPQVGEFIYGPRYRYTIATVTSTTVTATVRTDLKGSTGTSATNVVCGNEAQIISCDKDAKVIADTTITIPFAGYTGSSRAACSVAVTDLPDGISVTSNTSATGGSSGADGSLVLTADANSTLGGNSSGTITLTFSCNSLTFVKKFAWSKAIRGADGANGTSPYVAYLTNEAQTFASGTAATVTTQLYAYQGTTEKNVTIKTVNGVTASTSDTATGKTGMNFNVSSTSATAHPTITFKSTTSLAQSQTEQLAIVYQISGESSNRTIYFSYSSTKTGATGAAAVSYSIEPNVYSVVKKVDDTYAPSTVTFYGYSKTGSNAKVSYSGRWKIETSVDGSSWTSVATSTSNESSKSYALSNLSGNEKLIKGSLYAAGTTDYTTTPLVTQTISILNDSEDIELGGRNLLKYTAYENELGINKRGNTITVKINEMTETSNIYRNNNSLQITCSAACVSGTSDIWQRCWTNQEVGKPLRLSLYVKGSVSAKAWFRLGGSSSTKGTSTGTYNITTDWIKLDIDLGTVSTAGTAGQTEIIYGFDTAGTYYVNSMMLEYSNIASEWSAAPEDSRNINLIKYTTTEKNETPDVTNNDIWTNNKPSTGELFIWQSDGVQNVGDTQPTWNTPICIYTPVATKSSVWYCLCNSATYPRDQQGHLLEPNVAAWRDTAFEWKNDYVVGGESFSTLEITTYQFTKTVYEDVYDIEKEIEDSEPVLDLNWLNFGKYTYLQNKQIEKLNKLTGTGNTVYRQTENEGVFFTNNEGTYRIHIDADGINFETYDSVSGTWGNKINAWNIDGTLRTDLITVTTINAKDISSGVMKLTDSKQRDGDEGIEASFILENAGFQDQVVKVSVDGIKVTDKNGNILYMSAKPNEGFQAFKLRESSAYFETIPNSETTRMKNTKIENSLIMFGNLKVIKTAKGFSIIGYSENE